MLDLKKYVGCACGISLMNHNDVTVGRITEVNEKNITISSNMNIPVIKDDEQFKIDIISEKLGDKTISAYVEKYGSDYVVIKDIEILVAQNTRKAFRVDSDVPTEVMFVNDMDTEYQVKIGDLSIGGAKLLSPISLQIEEDLIIKFETLEETLYITGELKNEVAVEDYFLYGCQFKYLQQKEIDKLNKYIFHLDRNLKK